MRAAVARPPELPRPPRRPWAVWIASGAALLLVLAGVLEVARRARPARPAAPGAPAAFVAAKRGKLVRSVRAGGVLAAVRFAGVSAPSMRGPGMGQLTVVRVAPAGSRVKKGDVLAEFERQAQLNNFLDRQAEFVSLTDQIAKRRAELDVEREKQKTDLAKARTDLEAARLENRRNEVVSRIDAEKNQQALAEAEATLKMLQTTLERRQAVADAELKILEIRRERERLQMENARLNYERLVVHSPIDGMVVLTPIWKSGQMGAVQEGDQVRPGVTFLQVVNSAEMVVRARINQLDAALLRPGQGGVVRLDAYPDLSLAGRVETISTIATAPGWWTKFVKTIPVVFSVQGSDPRLIPDISASVDVELESAPDAVLVPRGAVLQQAGRSEAGFVWVQRNGSIEARAVRLGPKNDLEWAVLSGLQEGEMVAASPPVGAAEARAGKTTPSEARNNGR